MEDLSKNYDLLQSNPGKFFADRQRQQTSNQIRNVISNFYGKLMKKPKITKKVMKADPKTANVLEMDEKELINKLLTDKAFASAFYRALQSNEFKETVYNEETGEYEEIEGFHAYADDGSPIWIKVWPERGAWLYY